MHSIVIPDTIAPPAANYAHAVRSVDAQVLLHTAGVVPVRPDGTVPDTAPEQAEVVWTNLLAILAEAGMVSSDVVAVTTYVVVGEQLLPIMAERDRALDGHLAASTLITVPALARPEWLVEISLVAAR
jgi:enamine deaminase RidA (YjgF/YER057c/UK114 family)